MAHQQLRDMIERPEILVMPGVFDGLSARLVKRRGYSAAFISGAGISESRLGFADMGLMGLPDSVAAAEAIVASTGLITIADADTGYGNAVNVHHTVQAFERAGVSGVMIEDQVWPKRCGHLRGKEVIPADEMVQKVIAAQEARRDASLVIMARTDAFATHGLAESVRRLQMYAEAGADLLFADAIRSEDDVATLAREVQKPLCVNMGFGIRRRPTTELMSAMRLQELGVAVAIYPRLLTASAMRGMERALAVFEQALGSRQPIEAPDLTMSQEDFLDIMGMKDYERLEARYEVRGKTVQVQPKQTSTLRGAV